MKVFFRTLNPATLQWRVAVRGDWGFQNFANERAPVLRQDRRNGPGQASATDSVTPAAPAGCPAWPHTRGRQYPRRRESRRDRREIRSAAGSASLRPRPQSQSSVSSTVGPIHGPPLAPWLWKANHHLRNLRHARRHQLGGVPRLFGIGIGALRPATALAAALPICIALEAAPCAWARCAP